MSDAPGFVDRRGAIAGLLLAAVSAFVLVRRGEYALDVVAANPVALPALLGVAVLAGLVAAARGSARGALAAAALFLVVVSPYRKGFPAFLDWALLAAAVAGLVVFVEAVLSAQRSQRLLTRLSKDPDDVRADADALAVVERTADRRMARARVDTAAAAGLVVAAVVAGRLVRVVFPPRLGASLELGSLYGATFFVLLAVAAVAGLTWRRARRESGDAPA